MRYPSRVTTGDTLERWATDFVLATDLESKFTLASPPRATSDTVAPRRIAAPGRPRSLVISPHAEKSPGRDSLRLPTRRARLLHTFLHHELQAAELMCWAILAFPETPTSVRNGLAAIARDEVRHMNLYREHIVSLGHDYGDFPVRDWFWERVPNAPTAAHFVATLGLGFEGANLDHTLRWRDRFRDGGDERAAEIQDIVCEEEIPHVRFALHWFRLWTGREDFTTWSEHLVPPLSPTLMRGKPLRREMRVRAGLSAPFLDELTAWREIVSGS
jgi:uncharacterized ferritin-like protein (DUF455 family)